MQQSAAKKKKKRKIVPWIILGIVVLAIVWFFVSNAMRPKEIKTDVISYTVQKSDITATVVGTGNLKSPEAKDVVCMTGLKIGDVLVKDGDEVAEGDMLVELDTLSILMESDRLLHDIDVIDGEIYDMQQGGNVDKLTSALNGRIKAVYAEEGSDVSVVMQEHGALALISADGLMAVDIPKGELKEKTSVKVALEGGKTVSGTVQKCIGEVAIVTVSDDGPSVGAPVQVLGEGDAVLGEGELYIHQELPVVAFSGSVSAVKVKDNSAIKSGDTLFEIKHNEVSAEYQELLKEREECVERLQRLYALYDDPFIYAEFSGIIREIYAEKGDTVAASMSGEGTSAAPDMSALSMGDYSSLMSGFSSSGIVGGIIDRVQEGFQWPTWGDWGNHSGDEEPEATPESTVAPTPMPNIEELMQDPQFQSAMEGIRSGLAENFQSSISSMIPSSLGSISMPDMSSLYPTPTTENVRESLSGDEAAVLSIAPFAEYDLEISIDELDVLSVAVGQEVQVKVDAAGGKLYDAVITEVSDDGSVSGGVAGYSVKILVTGDENLRAGMSATATIVTDSRTDVLTIPAAAIQEYGNHVYVYTSYDAETDTLGDQVEIQTGLSDGDNTELLGGLEEGTDVYYHYSGYTDLLTRFMDSRAEETEGAEQ